MRAIPKIDRLKLNITRRNFIAYILNANIDKLFVKK